MPDNDIFAVEVPPPRAKFLETIIHPENKELDQPDDAHFLPKRELKRLRKLSKELRSELRGYFSLKAELQSLAEAYHQLRAELHAAERGDQERIGKQIIALAARAKAVKAAMNPGRKKALRLTRIESRIRSHEAAVIREKHERQLAKELESEARDFASFLIDTWTRLGYCYRYHVDGNEITDRVKIERIIVTPDEVQFKVKISGFSLLGATINYLPRGVRAWDLVKPETLLELSAGQERIVRSPHADENFDFRNGAWVVTDRLGVPDGIPEIIRLESVLNRYPTDRRARIPLPLGVKAGRKINWIDLARHPHLGIQGQTGTGKSNVFSVIIATILRFNSPDEVRLIMVDLKEGVAFRRYNRVPHLEGAVITEVEAFAAMLQRLERLRVERMHQIGRVADDIDTYNEVVATGNRLPRIVLVIDEYQAIDVGNAEAKSIINRMMVQIATKGRAAGVHIALGTQTAFASIIPQGVKSNITFQVVGRQSTLAASLSSVGSGAAKRTKNIPGRMVVQAGPDLFDVQMPLCLPDDTTLSIQAAINHPTPVSVFGDAADEDTQPAEAITLQADIHQMRVIKAAIEQFGGALKARRIWEYLNDPAISQVKASKIVKEVVQKQFVEFNGCKYEAAKQEGNFYQLFAVSQLFDEKQGLFQETVQETEQVSGEA